METSILNSTKKVLGIDAEYTAFDEDIITHINTAFNTLTQLGVGPDTGFQIEDESAVWGDFTNDDIQLNSVKSYVYLKVRSIFDPPATQYLLESFQRQIAELEWRLQVYKDAS